MLKNQARNRYAEWLNVYTLEEGEEVICMETGEVLTEGREVVKICANGWNDDDEYMSYDYYLGNQEDFQVCADCENVIDINRDYYEPWNGGVICGHCFEHGDYYECPDCGLLVYGEDMVSINDGAFDVCPDCADNNYYQCYDCGEYFTSSHGWYDTYGDWHCEECSERREPDRNVIAVYHDHHYDGFIHYNEDGEVDGFDRTDEDKLETGFELEVEKVDADWSTMTQDAEEIIDLMDGRVYCEEDCSLRGGYEFILMPHTVGAFKKLPIKEMLDKLIEKGYTSHNNGRCGLHIHVSKEWFGKTREEQDENTTKIVHLYSKEYDFFLKCSRRSWEQADRWASKTECENFEDAKNKKRWANGHGVAVNLANMNGFGTVEFRLGRGTLKYESFMAWYDMHLAITRNAKNIEPDDVDLNKWLSGITEETKAYILERTGREVA